MKLNVDKNARQKFARAFGGQLNGGGAVARALSPSVRNQLNSFCWQSLDWRTVDNSGC